MKQPRRKLGDRLTKLQPKTVGLSEESLIESRPLVEGEELPLLVEPAVEGLAVADWIADHREFVDLHLHGGGGVLFRGFGVTSVAAVDGVGKAVDPELLEYRERSAPRTQLEGRVYTSTEYPKHQKIAFHNEFSYALTWPLRIVFCCLVQPGKGGETPIVDSRKVYRRLDPEIRGRFERHGVMYVRNYGGGIDLSWQEVFQTDDRSEVEEYCRRAPMSYEWLEGDRLRTRSVRPAAAVHPATGEKVWFNQAHLFHVSNLEASVRDSLLASVAEEDLPRNTCYGDGSSIPVAELDHIREVFDEVAVAFPWQRGDVLVLDNMLIAHGRNPFEGDRTIAVAMTKPYNAPEPVGSSA